MVKNKQTWLRGQSLRLAFSTGSCGRWTRAGWNHSKRGVTILLGAALSVGGMTQALDGVHFIVKRDLDRVQVVKQEGGRRKVVARIDDTFIASSIFKIARYFPDSIVSSQSALFDNARLKPSCGASLAGDGSSARNMSFITGTIREKFFKTHVPYGDIIHEQASRYKVDPALVAAVIETESCFNEDARSSVGARGLMQLMPRTGRWMGANDLYDADQNVEAGVKYLRYLQDRFDGNLRKTIAAYNAGEGTVRRYDGVPPYRETRAYVKNVMQRYKRNSRELEQFNRSADVDSSDRAAKGASE